MKITKYPNSNIWWWTIQEFLTNPQANSKRHLGYMINQEICSRCHQRQLTNLILERVKSSILVKSVLIRPLLFLTKSHEFEFDCWKTENFMAVISNNVARWYSWWLFLFKSLAMKPFKLVAIKDYYRAGSILMFHLSSNVVSFCT